MNEGKPTESPAGRADGDADQTDTSAPDTAPEGSPAAPADVVQSGGLVREAISDGSSAGSADAGQPSPPARDAITEGDFELARPEGAVGGVVPEAGSSRRSSAEAAESAGGAVRPPAGDQAESLRSAAPAIGPPAVADLPKPLHDPDPYSTPPYGEPGPWAPAPPVQHPAAPPASRTAVSGPTVPPPGVADVRDLEAPETPPLAPGIPGGPVFDVVAPVAPVPDVPAAGGAAFEASRPVPGAVAPEPGVSRVLGAEAPETPAPLAPGVPGAPVFDGVPPDSGAPVPGGAASEAPPVGSGVPGGSVFDGVPPALGPPVSGVRAFETSPVGSGAPGAPVFDRVPPASGAPVPGVAAPETPPLTPGAPAFVAPEVAPGSPVPSTEASADPWRRYDPWAAAPLGAGPLQQTGGAVLSVEQRRRRRRRGLVGGALLLALVSGVVGGGVGVHLERNGGVGAVELPQAPAEPGGRAADSVAGIAARALPSVVTLHVSGSEEAGTGTGFVLDTRGHILTNSHVVEPAGSGGEISVVFNGGQTAEAEVVGKDSGYDLAVVRVTGVRGLRPLPLGNSDNVRVGDPVVAIGAPFDLEGTVTSGIISAKERPITAGGDSGDASDVSYVDALQTDAPINPGNSGGPLLDTRGQVIGINSAIRSAADGTDSDGGQSGSIGLGFAIPVNQGKRVAEELINTGRATHPVIGVTLDMDYAGDGARVGTDDSGGSAPVTAGGPGDRAGIRPGDVITAVDGRRVHSGEELIVKTRAHRPGDRLELTVERDGKERTLSLVLGSSDSG
ncbi:trypsin-like peptidase domain-containing protein [Streptomyces bobili]|uniref:Trypsin-like peptidase domain-containing protein n=1 Tax=Streptomyces bobili TaxID=67280 RepID=A0ABZ1QZ63_9ACTN|nr:trypsin-like peptidase domain-containing protein [Streptomyces bobili]